MTSKEFLFSELGIKDERKIKESEQLIKSFLKYSNFNTEINNIPDILLPPLRTALTYWPHLIDDEIEGSRNEFSNMLFIQFYMTLLSTRIK